MGQGLESLENKGIAKGDVLRIPLPAPTGKWSLKKISLLPYTIS